MALRCARHAVAALGMASAGVAGCSGDEVVDPVSRAPIYEGMLDLELEERAAVTIETRPDGTFTVSLAPEGTAAAGFMTSGAVLRGEGHVEPFPEAGAELLIAEWPPAVVSGGRCGTEPVVVALSLMRRNGTLRFGGALTGYCGSVGHGVPAGVLRLSGELGVR